MVATLTKESVRTGEQIIQTETRKAAPYAFVATHAKLHALPIAHCIGFRIHGFTTAVYASIQGGKPIEVTHFIFSFYPIHM